MQVSFLQQRLYPTMRLGTTLRTGDRTGSQVHCRQSDFDSACGSHCVAMVLALVGKIKDPVRLSRGRTGIAGRLWKAAQDSYFSGTDEKGLVTMLDSLNADLAVKSIASTHRKITIFAETELSNGGLVILSFRTPNHKTHHWVTVCGVEGRLQGRTFEVETFLLLDPSLPEPSLCGYNARLELKTRPVPNSALYVEYVPILSKPLAVTFTSAVSVQKKL